MESLLQCISRYLRLRGQVLSFGEAKEGMRTYLLIAGGFDMPKILGSSSTFTLGGFGGHGGRALRTGDVLGVNKAARTACKTRLSLLRSPTGDDTRVDDRCHPWTALYRGIFAAGVFDAADRNELGGAFQLLADGGSFDRACSAIGRVKMAGKRGFIHPIFMIMLMRSVRWI